MPWLEITIIVLALGTMAIGIRRLRGPGGGYWVWGWASLMTTGAVLLVSDAQPALEPLASGTALLFPLLILAGALHYGGRRISPWFGVAALGLAAARTVLAATGPPAATHAVALLVEPTALIAAAWLVHRALEADASPAQRLLAPGLLVVAGVEVFGSVQWIFQPGYEVALWLWVAVAIPNMCLQAFVSLERAGSAGRSAEQALRVSEQNLRDAQRIAQVGSYEWRPATSELVWSEENYRIFGWDPLGEPATHERFMRAVHPDDRVRLSEAAARSAEAGEPVDLEYRIRRPDGEERILHGRGETAVDAQGRLLRLQGTNHDITERLRSETALRTSEERLRAILNALEMDKVVEVDRNGFVRSILGDTGSGSRYGILPQDVPGRHICDFLPGRAGRHVLLQVARAFEDGEPRELEADVPFPEGRFHFEVALRPLRGSSGDVASVLAVVRDVTERRRSEHALRESEERLQVILSSLSRTRVVLLGRGGRVRSVYGGMPNPERYGLDSLEDIGRSIGDLVPAPDLERGRLLVNEVFDTGETREMRQTVHLPGGEFVYDIILSPVRDGGEEILSVLAVAVDVTDRVKSEEQRRRMEAQLQQARKLESLGVMAGGIAHDFNNLLVGILSNAETALSGLDEDSALMRPLEDIYRASERAADLTHQLLAYAGKAKFSAHALNLAWLVDEMTPLLRPLVTGGARIEIVRGSRDPWVHADATQLRQLLMNLITNASEALGESGGRIRIRTDVRAVDADYLEGCYLREDVCEGDFALLEVSDDGEGMDPGTVERIFDPFFTTKFQGRGLGLASALGIVRSHGGTVRVESQAGRGTAFCVLLPLSEPGTLPGEAPRSVPDLGGGTVLVVDDEDLVRSAARRMLEAQGFQVFDAPSGAEAIEWLGEHAEEVDVLLVDVTMPDMDGEQTLAAARAIRPDLPAVFMSGHSVEDVTARLADRSRAVHLHKPFRLAELGDAVRSVLELADEGR